MIKKRGLPLTIFLASAALLGVRTSAQTLPDSLEYKIDKIVNLTKLTSPGAVIAIVRNDSVLFEKGYGLANAEYNIKNTPQSIYYICSLAKQFTAYSIILLADQNKLKLDDDITLYLPWAKNFGQPSESAPPRKPGA